MTYIPDELESLRVEKNLSIREVARRAGVSAPTTIGVLQGRGLTTSAVAVANALNYSIRWTFYDAESKQRRLLLLPGSLATQLSVYRRKYVGCSVYSLAAPGLTRATIHDLERGLPTRFVTLERYARLLGLEPILVRGALANTLDMRGGGVSDEYRRQHC